MIAPYENRSCLNSSKEFERVYVDLRRSEKRIYSDEEVAWLPEVGEDHIYKEEWDIRKSSCKKVMRYLESKDSPLKILEVGCGNGWLSYQLSQIRSSYVIGLDVNLCELQQAERVFMAIPNLAFVYGDIDSASLGKQKFDIVVFAAAIQYFESLRDIVPKIFEWLNDNGEIHIMDSHFYSSGELNAARERSSQYFRAKGFDRMKDFYFHHSLEELNDFSYSMLYNPNSGMNKVLGTKNPFPWIRIK
jgi:ubiquinone/menaquinone biosynthesis C-methylase UbiE